MSSKYLLSFLFGLVLLVTFSFAASSSTPNYIYKNVVEKSHVDQFPTYFDSSIAKLLQSPEPEPEPVDSEIELEPGLVEPKGVESHVDQFHSSIAKVLQSPEPQPEPVDSEIELEPELVKPKGVESHVDQFPTPNYIYKNVVEKSHVDKFPTYFDSSITKLLQSPEPEPEPVDSEIELVEPKGVESPKRHEPDFADIPHNGQQTTENYKSVFENSHNFKIMLPASNGNTIKVANLKDRSIRSPKLQQASTDDLVKTGLIYKPHF